MAKIGALRNMTILEIQGIILEDYSLVQYVREIRAYYLYRRFPERKFLKYD